MQMKKLHKKTKRNQLKRSKDNNKHIIATWNSRTVNMRQEKHFNLYF